MEGGDDDILWWTVPLTLQMSHEASQAHEIWSVYGSNNENLNVLIHSMSEL